MNDNELIENFKAHMRCADLFYGKDSDDYRAIFMIMMDRYFWLFL